MADLLTDAEVMGQRPGAKLLSDADVMGAGRDKAATPPAPESRGLAVNAAAGGNEAIASMAGAPVDAATWLINHAPGTILVNKGAEALGFKAPIPKIENPLGGSESLKRGLGLVGANPDDVKAVTPGEHLARAAGSGAASMLIPGLGAEVALTRTAKAGDSFIAAALDMIKGTGPTSNAAIGAASGVGADVAADAVPEPYKPLASMAGGLAAGVGAAGTMAAGGAAGGLVRDLTKAAIEPAELRAARQIEARASEPGKFRQDVAEAAEAPPLVEGSSPTTFQATGDLGVGALEREVAASPTGVAPFAARREQQNAARLEALGELADPAADAQVVTDYVRSRLAAITQEHDTKIASATRSVADALSQAGGQHFDNPAAYGEALQVPLSGLHQRAQAAASKLWRAIDPDMEAPVNVAPLKQGAADLMDTIARTAKPPEGEEAAILTAIGKLDDQADFGSMVALRSRLTEAIRDERKAGSPTALRRLNIMLGHVDDTLAKTAGEIAANPDMRQGLVADLKAEAQDWQANLEQRYGIRAGESAGAGDGGVAPGTTGRVSPAPGDQGQGGGQSGIPAGGQGVPATGGIAPDVAERYAAARGATAEMKGLYDNGPVGAALAPGARYGTFKMTASNVARNLFDRPEALQSFVDAAKGDPAALAPMRDYAAFSLRQAAVKDGMLSPAKYQKWMEEHGYALRQFPELADKFANVKAAQTTLDDAFAAQKAALTEYQTGAARRFLDGQDPTQAAGKALANPGEFAALAAHVSADPAAAAGLKRAVVDYMMGKALSTAESGTSGLPQINAATLQKFYLQNRKALASLFSDQELNNMERVASDLQRANRSIVAVKIPGGSNTAQDTGTRAMSVLQNVVQQHGGKAVGGTLGGTAGFIAGAALDALRAARMNRIDKAVTEMMLDPKMAALWMAKVPEKSGESVAASFIRRTRAAIADQVTNAVEEEKKAPAGTPNQGLQHDTLYTMTGGLLGAAPAKPVTTLDVPRETRYPDHEDLARARLFDQAYGDKNAGFFEAGDSHLRQIATKLAPLVVNDSRYDEVPWERVDAKTADMLYTASIAAHRSAIASLGFDPRKMVLSPPSEDGLTAAGTFSSKHDAMWIDQNHPSAMVHESFHRGLEELRKSGALAKDADSATPEKPYVSKRDEENMVRALMIKNFGTVEKGSGDLGDEQVGMAERSMDPKRSVFADNFNAKLAAVEALAAKEIARLRPRGPR